MAAEQADRATLDTRMSVVLAGLCSVFAAALAGGSTSAPLLAAMALALFVGWMLIAVVFWQGNDRLGTALQVVLGIASVALAFVARSQGFSSSPLLVLAPMAIAQATLLRVRNGKERR